MMVTAARVTVVEVEAIMPVGALDPETIVMPSIYVQPVVLAPMRA
jgi:3-oxoadipate CoA-transferase, alpha subunit